jgi:glycine hydroxymethyltransferase
VGTAAITSRGFNETHCRQVVSWIDEVLTAPDNATVQAKVRGEIHEFMSGFPLYA